MKKWIFKFNNNNLQFQLPALCWVRGWKIAMITLVSAHILGNVALCQKAVNLGALTAPAACPIQFNFICVAPNHNNSRCAKLIQAFDDRFQDVKNIQKELEMFATPFNVQPSVPDTFQVEIIGLQNNYELKAKYNSLSLLDFHKLYVHAEAFPILARHALKFASLFGTTYHFEQVFSKLTLAKRRFHSRLTESNLKKQLRVASSSSLPADIRHLAKKKQFQPSH